MSKKYLRLLLVAVIVGSIFLILKYTGWYSYFSLQSFKREDHFLKIMMRHNYWGAVGLFIAFFSFTTAASIPGSALLSIFSGYLFGFQGCIYSVISAAIGAVFSFLLFKYVLYAVIVDWYGEKVAKLSKKLQEHRISYLLLLHYITIVPFSVINAVAVMSKVPIQIFVLTTVLGTMPVTFIYTFAGRQLRYINSISDIFSWPIIGVFFLLMLLALCPILLKKYKKIDI